VCFSQLIWNYRGVRQQPEPLKRQVQLHWKSVAVAAVVGVLVVVLTWLAGPGLFGGGETPQGTVVQAEITKPTLCSVANAQETVRFPLGGTTRDGTLNACGHGQGERVDITVPADAGDGLIQVNTATVVAGSNDLRRPVALGLLAISSLAGACYAFLLIRATTNVTTAKATGASQA
jgi:hypothetical protein